MDSGGLVTDEIVIGIIKDEIEKEGIIVLQCVAVCCSVLQCVVVIVLGIIEDEIEKEGMIVLQCVAV